MTEKNWKNRITGYGEESPDQLLANPHNHRIHPKRQQDALGGSLDTLGYIQTVIVNRATGHIVDGHLRVTMALREGQKSIPVTYVELTEEEEAQALLSLDPIAAMAATDKDKVDELLRMVNTDNEQVMKHLSDFAAENKLEWGQPEQVDAPAEIDKAAELAEKWQTSSGQLWKLGDHRLLIGDCTVRENVERLMGGDRADMTFIDPPYGVDYEGGAQNEKKREKLDGDENGDLYFPLLSLCKEYSKKSAPMYVWFAASVGKPVYDAVAAIGYKVRAMIIWNKLDAHYGAFMAQYMQKHEPCLYIVDGNSNWIGASNEITVWDLKQPSKNEFHPTQKPVELAIRAIGNHEAQIVIDLCGGSGTSIMACQSLKRKARVGEISEKYGAVILERFYTATGIMPELLNQGSQK